MKDLVVKMVRWYLVALFSVAGCFCLFLAEAGQSFKPLMPAVLSFGVAYTMGFFWHKYSKLNNVMSVSTFVLTGFLSLHADDIVYIATGQLFSMNFYLLWVLLLAAVGIPFMAFFLKDE